MTWCSNYSNTGTGGQWTVAELAKRGYYGVIFHRIIDDFVTNPATQARNGADATCTGGSSLGNFDDEFHPDLQNTTGNGVLSFAKSSDELEQSRQFFITSSGREPHLQPTRSSVNSSRADAVARHSASRNGSATLPINHVRIQQTRPCSKIPKTVSSCSATRPRHRNQREPFTITDSDGQPKQKKQKHQKKNNKKQTNSRKFVASDRHG